MNKATAARLRRSVPPGKTIGGRNYFDRKIGETEEHARKRVMKGIVGCQPANKTERLARRFKPGFR